MPHPLGRWVIYLTFISFSLPILAISPSSNDVSPAPAATMPASGEPMPEVKASDMIIARQYEQAIDFLKDTQSRQPENYRLAFLHAIALEHVERPEEAITAFLHTLDYKKEIPPLPASPVNSWQKQIPFLSDGQADMLPVEAVGVMQIWERAATAYLYRQVSTASWRYQNDESKITVPMPTSLKDIPTLVIIHLARIAGRMGSGKIDTVAALLKTKGIAYADLKLSMDRQSTADPEAWESWLKRYPNNPVVQALWILSPAFPGKANQNSIRDLFEKFRSSHPSLAVLAAFGALQLDPLDQNLFLDGLALLQVQKRIPPLVFYEIAQKIMYLPAVGQPIDEGICRQVATTLTAVYPKAVKETNGFSIVPFLLAHLLVQTHDYRQLVDFLERIAEDYPTSQPASFPVSSTFPSALWSETDGNRVYPLSFPPSVVPGFSSVALSTIGMLSSPAGAPLETEKLWPEVNRVKNPLLKVLLTQLCGKDREVSDQIKNLLKTSPHSLGVLILAAAWKTWQEDSAGAFALLQEAGRLTPEPSVRRMIDGAILALALESDNDTTLQAAGKAIATRLMGEKLTPEQQRQLLPVLQTLGMEDQAQTLAQTLASIKTPSPDRSLELMDPSHKEKVATLFREGEKAQAVDLLVRDFRSVLEPVVEGIDNTPGGNYAEYPLQESIQQVMAYNALEPFLARLAAGPSPNLNRRLQLAFACELLGNPERAIAEYRQVLTEKPRQDFANLRLALLLAKPEPDQAQKHLVAAAAVNPERVGQTLSRSIDREEFLVRAFPKIRLAIEFLKLLSSKPLPYAGPMNFFSILERPRVENQVAIPPLFTQPLKTATQAFAERPDGKDLRDLLVQRDTVYRQLCDAAMTVPSLAVPAFSRKLLLLQLNGEPLEPLVGQAEAALLCRLMTSRYRDFSAGFRSLDGEWGDDRLPLVTPEMFLADQAIRQHRTDRIKPFLDLLERAGGIKARRQIEQLMALYAVPAEQFTALAEGYALAPSRSIISMPDRSRMKTVIQIWSQTKNPFPLTPLVLKAIEQGFASPYSFTDASFAALWGRELYNRWGSTALRDYLDQLNRMALTNVNLDKLLVGRYAGFGWTPNRAILKLNAYRETLQALIEDNHLFPEVLDHLQTHPVLLDERLGLIGQLAHRAETMVCNPSYLVSLPLFKEWKAFHAYALAAPDQKPVSLLGWIVAGARELHDRDRKALLNKIKAIQPPTFGSGLVSVLIESDSPAAVFSFLGRYLPEIRKASADRQNDLLQALRGYLARYGSTAPPTDPAGSQFFVFYNQASGTMSSPPVDAFLAKSVSDFAIDDYLKEAGRLILALIPTDEAQAGRVYDHALKTVLRARKRNLFLQSDWSPQPKKELLTQLLESCSDLLTLRFVSRKSQLPDGDWVDFEMDDDLSRAWRTILPAWIRGKNIPDLKTDDQRQTAVRTSLDELDHFFKGVYPHSIAEAAFLATKTFTPEEKQKLIDWINAKPDKSYLLQKTEASLSKERLEKAGKFVEEPSSYWVFFVRVIRDPNLSPGLRLALYKKTFTGWGPRPEHLAVVLNVAESANRLGTDPFRTPHMIDMLASTLYTLKVDPAWEKQVGPLCEHWRKAVFGQLPAGRPDDVLDRDMTLAMLKLHFKRNDLATVKRILSHSPLKLAEFAPAYVVLLNFPVQDWLVENLAKHAQDIDLNIPWPAEYPLSDAMRSAADRVIAAMPSGELKYFAGVLYATFPQYVAAGPPTKRSKDVSVERRRQLAQTFKTQTFSDPALRRRCLDLLLRDDKLAFLKQEIPEAAEMLSALAVATDQTELRDRRIEQFKDRMLTLLAEGKLVEFKNQVDTLKPALALQNYYPAQDMLYSMCELLGYFLTSGISSYPIGHPVQYQAPLQNKPEEYLKVGKDMLMMNRYVQGRLAALYGPVITLHFICDKPVELKVWFKEQSECFKKMMTDETSVLHLEPPFRLFLRTLPKFPQADDLARQAQRFMAFLAAPEARAVYAMSTRFLSRAFRGMDFREYTAFTQALRSEFTAYAGRPDSELKKDPRSDLILGTLTETAFQEGSYEEVEILARKWQWVNAGSAPLEKLFFALEHQHRYDEAIPIAQALVKMDTKDFSHRYLLRRIYEEAGQPDKAIEVGGQLLAGKEPTFDDYRESGRLLVDAKRYDRAMEVYRQGLANVKGDRKEYFQIGIATVLVGQGKFAEAEKIAEGLKKKAVYGEIRMRAEELLRKIEKNRTFRELVPDPDKVVLQDLKDVKVLSALACFYDEAGDATRAEAVCRQWVSVQPGPDSYSLLVRQLWPKKKFDEAVRLCRDLVRQYPNESRYTSLLVQSYLRNGQKTQALDLARQKVKENKRDFNSFLLLVNLLISNGQAGEAQAVVQEIIKQIPSGPLQAMYKLEYARILLHGNQREEGRRILQEMVDDASNPVARQQAQWMLRSLDRAQRFTTSRPGFINPGSRRHQLGQPRH